MRILVALTALLMSSAAVFADTMEDCRAPDPARAIEACSRVVQSKDETKANQVTALSLRAVAYMRKNELDKAITDLNRALNLDAKNVFALSVRGEVHIRASRYDRAVTDLTEALKLQPTHSTALSNRGHVYVTMGDYERAKQDLDKAITVNPSAPFPYAARGRMYRMKGEIDRAFPRPQSGDRSQPAVRLRAHGAWRRIPDQR